MAPDWDDTVRSREAGEVVGFVGTNETIDAGEAAAKPVDQPIEDVRRDAVESTEDAGVDVVDPVPQPPASNNDPAPKASEQEGVAGPDDNGNHYDNSDQG